MLKIQSIADKYFFGKKTEMIGMGSMDKIF